MQLPHLPDDAAVDAFMADRTASTPILEGLVHHAGLLGAWTRPVRGSALIALGAHEVVKVMAPRDREHAHTELTCLTALAGRLPVPTPEVLASGEIDGWCWVRFTRLQGEELADAWPTLTNEQRLAVCTQVGELIAALHALEPPDIEVLDWPSWTASRLADLEATQRRRGCPEVLLAGLTSFVAGSDLREGRRAWLHTEIMREHLLIERRGGSVRLTGLFDFEPSWVGPEHYEYASIGLFVSAGEPALFGEIQRAAGVRLDPRRVFAVAMMHRYANLRWYHARLGGPTSLPELAEAWFGSA